VKLTISPINPRSFNRASLFVAIISFVTPLSFARAQTMLEMTIPSPPAKFDNSVDRERAVGCLATAIAYEAGYESTEGQQAVAEVILNRLRHPAFPKTVCGVVFAGAERRTGCQFSFTCDGSLNRPMRESIMANTRAVALAALDGLNPLRVGGATHYHADYVSPYWAPSLIRVTKIGAHIFYRGAGARDIGNTSTRYIPNGEPQISAVTQSGSSGQLASMAKPGLPATPPVAFAPWGLAPLPTN
jgi:Cell Wall Hydrolase